MPTFDDRGVESLGFGEVADALRDIPRVRPEDVPRGREAEIREAVRAEVGPAPDAPLTPEEQRFVDDVMEADGSLSKAAAIAYVSDLVATYLRGELRASFAAREGEANPADPLAEKDAATCIAVCDEMAMALEAAAQVALAERRAEKRRIVPSGGAKLLSFPGGKKP